jgi:hypothetical protein
MFSFSCTWLKEQSLCPALLAFRPSSPERHRIDAVRAVVLWLHLLAKLICASQPGLMPAPLPVF